MSDVPLTPEQEAEAQRIYASIHQAFGTEARRLARLMASKPDAQLLGATEFSVRDRVLRLGAEVVQAALNERKKGGTAPAAPAAPAAGKRPAASAGDSGASSR
jgi:hypothetical protein